MRQPYGLLPSLLISFLLTSLFLRAVHAGIGAVIEAALRPRAIVNARSNVHLPAARAAIPEPAAATLAARQMNQELEERQNYYAFSGAIYIVGQGGQSLSGLNAASPAYCPNNAPQSCGNINVWNWCCPSGNTCAWADPSQTYVGCCPAGYTCQQGTINRNQVQTVTVYVTTTQYNCPGCNGGGIQSVTVQSVTTTQQGGGGAGNVIIVGTTTAPVTYNGFCTTIYAQNIATPTRAAVPCGVALVVNEGHRFQISSVLSLMGGFWVSMIGLMAFARLFN